MKNGFSSVSKLKLSVTKPLSMAVSMPNETIAIFAGIWLHFGMSRNPAAQKYDRIHPETREAWRDWLLLQHKESPGIWLVSYKKATGRPRFAETEAIEEALCFGWIDSLPRFLDDERSMLLMTPRKLKSNWSAINKERATRMIAEGRMQPAGQMKIDHALANAQWDALNVVEAMTVPLDLESAFGRFPGSDSNFNAFPKSAKRGILEWILNAKGDETRSRRINETARLAAENIRANQWSKPKA
jgi:uncharacterized protein YdeI (YjbR/CyaY-like superfamily)